MYNTTTGYENTALGAAALYFNTTGYKTISIGANSLNSNTSGNTNTAIGHSALISNTTGSYNIAIGASALSDSSYNGSGNIQIGGINSSGTYVPVSALTTQNDRIVMGSTAVTNAYIKVSWTVTSDERDKTEFDAVPHGLDFVDKLNPVSYKFRVNRSTEQTSGPIRYGFKAQDILALEGNNSVIIDSEDQETLRMNETQMIPVLVNAIKELKQQLNDLKQEFEAWKVSHP